MKNKNGSILVLAVIMVVVMLIIGLALITLGSNARMQAIRSQLIIEARTAADAGIAHAIKAMRNKLPNPFQPVWVNSPLPSQTDFVVPGSTSGYGPAATFTYAVVGNQLSGWNITSTGTANAVQRTVHCKIIFLSHSDSNDSNSTSTSTRNTGWPAIAVMNSIDIKLGTTFGTYPNPDDSRLFTLQTNSTLPNAITIKAGVTIPGDVVVGQNGDPAAIIDTKASTVINGYTYAAPVPIPFPPVIVPSQLLTIGPSTYAYDPCGLSGNLRYGSTTINDIQNIKGVTRIYIDGKLTLGNSAGIVIQPNSSLELYLNGNLEGKNSMGVNNLTDNSINLKIFGTAACTQIDLKAKSDALFCAVYAPSADLNLYNGAALYGAFVGNNVSMKNSGAFYLDTRLMDINEESTTTTTSTSTNNSFPVDFAIVQGSWWEE